MGTEKLNALVPRPAVTKKNPRKFIALAEGDYLYITDLAVELDTTRGRIISALCHFYQVHEND